MFLNVRYIHFWYLESHFRNGTWKKHPTFHIARTYPVDRRCCWRMSLFLAAADPKVGAPHTDIATRTNMNQTKLISKFGSGFLIFVLFFLGEPLVLSFSGCCMLCCFYFATTYKPTTKSQRVNPPLKDTRCGNSSSYLFGMVYEFLMFFFATFPNPHRKKNVCFFRCFPHGVATQHLHLCLVALDPSRRYLQRGGAAHGTADVAALGGGEGFDSLVWGKYWGKLDLTGD